MTAEAGAQRRASKPAAGGAAFLAWATDASDLLYPISRSIGNFMEFPKSKAASYIAGLIFFISGGSAYASSEDATPLEDRRICGEYTALSDPHARELFERHCGTYKEQAFKILRELVNQLDAKREARAAALRGDFRLATIIAGPPRHDQPKLWHLAGVHCENIDDPDIFIWLRRSDSLIPDSKSQSGFQNDMTVFAEEYNIAMISEKSYPSSRACQPNR